MVTTADNLSIPFFLSCFNWGHPPRIPLSFLTRTADSFASYTLGSLGAHLTSFLCWISYFWIQSCLLFWLISLIYWGITPHSFLSKGLREIVLKFYLRLKMYIFCPQSWLVFWQGIEFSDVNHSKNMIPLSANISFQKYVAPVTSFLWEVLESFIYPR